MSNRMLIVVASGAVALALTFTAAPRLFAAAPAQHEARTVGEAVILNSRAELGDGWRLESFVGLSPEVLPADGSKQSIRVLTVRLAFRSDLGENGPVMMDVLLVDGGASTARNLESSIGPGGAESSGRTFSALVRAKPGKTWSTVLDEEDIVVDARVTERR